MAPVLLIFDIDDTLIKSTGIMLNSLDVRKALFDVGMLTPYLLSRHFQIAIASFNSYTGDGYGGRILGRKILDLQYPGSSKTQVPDDFIQAWIFDSSREMHKHGKNIHIEQILQAYWRRYGSFPQRVYFFDDNFHNVSLAENLGITSHWTPKGVTRRTLAQMLQG